VSKNCEEFRGLIVSNQFHSFFSLSGLTEIVRSSSCRWRTEIVWGQASQRSTPETDRGARRAQKLGRPTMSTVWRAQRFLASEGFSAPGRWTRAWTRTGGRARLGDRNVGVVRDDGIAWGQTVSVQERTRGECSSRRFCFGSARSDQIGGAAIGCTWVPSTSDQRKSTLGAAADRIGGAVHLFFFFIQLPIRSARSRKLGKTWSNSFDVLISPWCSRSDLSSLVVEQTQIGSEPVTQIGS
jgi:hypothetical protein